MRLPEAAGIQDVFRTLCDDGQRTAAIANEIERAFEEGRKVLALTERTKHLDDIVAALGERVSPLIVLHGRLSKKLRDSVFEELNALQESAPRVVLATGKLVGEGFDHPALDTLILCMQISWKGTLQQYAGRLHSEYTTKSNVRIVDFVDTGHPASTRMWDKRQRGYRAMGYRIAGGSVSTRLPGAPNATLGTTDEGFSFNL
jgi:superfamily II DNA or RNA helicase